MMWLILTPFLVLCLAAVGLTLAEAADFLRARHLDSAHVSKVAPIKSSTSLGGKHSFYPDDLDHGMTAIPNRSFTFTD